MPRADRAGEGFWSVATYSEAEHVLRDPGDVLVRATEFHVGRDPNPHLSFGQGLHYCLGASLARLEMRVMFAELLAQFSTYELAGPVEWTRSNRHTGIRHLPVRLKRA